MKTTHASPEEEFSFNSWLTDKQHRLEQTAGVVVLFLEMLDIVIHQIFHNAPDIPITQGLNLGFLIFLYIQLAKRFKKRYTLDDRDQQKVSRILRLWRYTVEHKQQRIDDLVSSSNKSIRQLSDIKYFVLATAVLYFFLLVKILAEIKGDPYHIFHILFDLISYIGAFYLLRAFFVMYSPTIEHGVETLNKKTYPYIFVGVGLMVIDLSLTRYVHAPIGTFVGEYLCGIVNAVVFVLLVAQFQNKILDIPSYILLILFTYAVLQTCLPFVTETGLVIHQDFSEGFSSVIFRLVLVGKLALAAMLLYVLSSGRMVYYFMFVKNLHEEEKEEAHWDGFRGLLNELPCTPEPFEIIYELDSDSKLYKATIVPRNLFGRVTGIGKTKGKARDSLIEEIKEIKKNK